MTARQIAAEDLCDILESAAQVRQEHQGPYLITEGEHPSLGRFIIADTGLAPPLLISLE